MKANPPFVIQLDHINRICAEALEQLSKEGTDSLEATESGGTRGGAPCQDLEERSSEQIVAA
jgi:hypothetical protein